MEVKIPRQAFPWRHAKDPRRNLQSLAVRYFICLVEGRRKLREGLGFGLILNVIQSQEEAGATVPGTSEEKRASEPALDQEGPGPVAPSLAKQQIEWTSGETGPMPSSTQGEPTQKAPSTEASHGGDLGSGLKHRTEVGMGDVLCRIKMSLYTWSAPSPCFCSGLVPMPLRCVCFSVTFFFFCHPFDSLPHLPRLPLCFLAMAFSSSVKGSFLIPVGVDPAKSSSCFSVFPLLF